MKSAASLPLLACLAALTSFVTPAFAAPPAMQIQADAVTLNLDKETTEATGQAKLSYGEVSLNADAITANRQSGDVEAAGQLSLTQAGRRLEGDNLSFNFLSNKGVLHNAHVREQGVIIRGESIEFSPQQIVARHANFTTCQKPTPDYSLAAGEISLTAPQTIPGKQPESGKLTLDHARVNYHRRSLFTLPRYSVRVGQIGEQGTSPFPASGFDREDGPYAQIGYSVGGLSRKSGLDFSYRYTTLRGIRGYLKFAEQRGPLEFQAAMVRREVTTDRELKPDDFATGLANVMVNREPEFGLSLTDLRVGRSLSLRAELRQGSYSETEHFTTRTRVHANRTTASGLLSFTPYRVAPKLSLSHAIGWRESSYSTGSHLSIHFLRHSLKYTPSSRTGAEFSYVTRRGAGQTPFLFDSVEVGRGLLSDVKLRLNRQWRFQVVDLYDLSRRDTRDMMLAMTRTTDCLDYTIGWRKQRGMLFVGINLEPPMIEGRKDDRAGAPTTGDRAAAFGEH